MAAYNSAGSAWAASYATVNTPAASVTVPNAPSNVTGTATSATQIKLSWADNSNNETGFQIERWNGSAWTQIGTVGPNVTTYADSGLIPSTTYYYEVAAYNSAGSAWAASYATVNTPAASVTVPNAPSNVTGTATSATQIKLSWADNSNNETGFQIERWNGSAWTQIGTVGPNVTTYADSGLNPSTTYYYEVAAYNSAGSAWAASYATVNTPAATVTVPNAPSNVTGTATSATQIKLSWADNSNNETGFQIERWNGSAWTQIGTVGPNVTTYADSGLNPSTTYYYEVAAYNSAGTAWAASYATVNTPAVLTQGQQFTFNQEGGFRAAPYHPSSDSGVTIAVGYDMKERSAASIVSDLVAAGVDRNTATILSQAAGLTGTTADQFVRNNQSLTMTPAQGNALFFAVYAAKAEVARSVATSAAVVQLYGLTNWDALNQKIKDILIDMTYRGDYTVDTRMLIQKYVVNNDLAGFTKEMSIRADWLNVPLQRFNARVTFLNT